MVRNIGSAVIAMGLLGAACSDAPSTDQCGKLLDKLIDQEISATGGKELPESMKADLAKQKAALTEAIKADFMKSCTKKAPKAVVECGLSAKSVEDFAKCDGN